MAAAGCLKGCINPEKGLHHWKCPNYVHADQVAASLASTGALPNPSRVFPSKRAQAEEDCTPHLSRDDPMHPMYHRRFESSSASVGHDGSPHGRGSRRSATDQAGKQFIETGSWRFKVILMLLSLVVGVYRNPVLYGALTDGVANTIGLSSFSAGMGESDLLMEGDEGGEALGTHAEEEDVDEAPQFAAPTSFAMDTTARRASDGAAPSASKRGFWRKIFKGASR